VALYNATKITWVCFVSVGVRLRKSPVERVEGKISLKSTQRLLGERTFETSEVLSDSEVEPFFNVSSLRTDPTKRAAWRADGYPTEDYPAIAEILDYALLPGSNGLRFLRSAQLRALETYWYLRLVEGTPHIFDLYRRYYPRPLDLLAALGLDRDEIKDFVLNEGLDALWPCVREDEGFVKAHKLESVHETLVLDYSSYILALAMGAGKTMLIGAIVASEFAMALEYPGGPFIQNALVFAPGLTILESLRELAEVDYSKILPPRLDRPFEATYKLVFTHEGETDLPVIRGSRYNLIVTNTEKIRIQKRTYRHASWTDLQYRLKLEQSEEQANLRLLAIASLPTWGSSPTRPIIPTAQRSASASSGCGRRWTTCTKRPA